jgi:hypothetical protein
MHHLLGGHCGFVATTAGGGCAESEAEHRSPDGDGNATAGQGRILEQKDNKKRFQARCNHTYGFLEGL